jgi:hypothetical protein
VEAVIESGVGAITRVKEVDAVRAGLLVSVANTVKLEDPLAVGVPDIVPVEGARFNPAGSLPEAIDHV